MFLILYLIIPVLFFLIALSVIKFYEIHKINKKIKQIEEFPKTLIEEFPKTLKMPNEINIVGMLPIDAYCTPEELALMEANTKKLKDKELCRQ